MSRRSGAPEPSTSRSATAKLAVLAALLLGLGVLVALGGGAFWADLSAWVDSLGFWGPLVFAACYALAVAALVPGSVLNASAGALFGVALGSVAVIAGASAGAALSFGLARLLGRPAVARFTGSGRLARLESYLSRRAFESILVLRMVSMFPFGAVNYGAGVAGVGFAPYMAGTVLGIVPGTLVYTGLGEALREPGSPAVWIAPAGLVVLSAGGWYASRLVRARTARTAAAKPQETGDAP
ncbi:VTT domain-containing protein [Spirillospora sp. NPDC029432]|uniref:TVP38/TMEM64 family protein n=1 Tax=Spirillospora sp. NPDC029432 TaxID=3154599 RepID=UPI0034564A1E